MFKSLGGKLAKGCAVALAAASLLGCTLMFSGCESKNPEISVNIEFNGEEYSLTYKLHRDLYSQTVAHYIELIDKDFFDGTVVHDFQSNRMVAGGYTYTDLENGDVLGYTADTIILPGNRPSAEMIVKKVCGSEGATGNGYNDINLQFGNWNIVVMPDWQASDDRVMIMSSEANRNLGGNMFFNRVPLTVSNWVDHHTGNYIWNGRCRFGVGFGTYKHILLAVDSDTAVTGATAIA